MPGKAVILSRGTRVADDLSIEIEDDSGWKRPNKALRTKQKGVDFTNSS